MNEKCKENPETCACACGLPIEDIDAVQGRLIELEDMRRELTIIHNASVLSADREKIKLTAEGHNFQYQQGGIDAWMYVGKVLEGLTNFFEFSSEVQEVVRKEKAKQAMEVM